MGRWGKATPQEQLEAAEKNLEGVKEYQRTLQREMRGMPGYKEALKTSATEMKKATNAVTKAKAEVRKMER